MKDFINRANSSLSYKSSFKKAAGHNLLQLIKLDPEWRLAMSNVIKFYSVNDEYGEFSNFALFPIRLKGKNWPTSEHYFQAMKFKSAADQDDILKSSTPMGAAKRGRDRKRKLREDWDSVKCDIMREAVRAKFNQYEDLKALLLSTRDAEIIEHTENDAYWGDGGNGSGKNMLGRILMEIREELKGEAKHLD